jgi:ABC-type multidrug transport system fused ATPase/permease subunit
LPLKWLRSVCGGILLILLFSCKIAVNVYNIFISVGLSSIAASLSELGKAVGALERISELVAPADDAGLDTSAHAFGKVSSSNSDTSSGSTSGSSVSADGSNSGLNSSSSDLATNRQAGRVEFRDVWFRYPGSQDWIIQGLSLTILPGQTLALVGPSGGGKSTISALLLGLYRPQRGDILVNGQPLDMREAGSSSAAAARIAAVLQQSMLMSGSVREQIRCVCGASALA